MTSFALARDHTMMGPLVIRVIWEGKMEGEKELLITFPSDTSREDYERMRKEIHAIIQQAERRGEQKVLTRPQAYLLAIMEVVPGAARTCAGRPGSIGEQ